MQAKLSPTKSVGTLERKVERILDEELRDFFDNISKRWRGKMENVHLPSVQSIGILKYKP